MTLDIQAGDILVYEGNEYAIKQCNAWYWEDALADDSIGLHLAGKTASTKRSPAIVSGKRGAPTTNLTSIPVTPLDPLSSDLAARIPQLDSAGTKLLVCIAYSPDTFYELVVEDVG